MGGGGVGFGNLQQLIIVSVELVAVTVITLVI